MAAMTQLGATNTFTAHRRHDDAARRQPHRAHAGDRTVEDPGAASTRSFAVNNAPPPPPPPNLTLTADMALCGTHEFGTLAVPSGRTLRVATAFDPAVVSPTSPRSVRRRCGHRRQPRPRDPRHAQHHRHQGRGRRDDRRLRCSAGRSAQRLTCACRPGNNGGAGHGGDGGVGVKGSGSNFNTDAFNDTASAASSTAT